MTTIRAVHVDRFVRGIAVIRGRHDQEHTLDASLLHDLPPPATEAEKRLVEAAIAHTRKGGADRYGDLRDAAEAVHAERKPPDPVDPVEEVIAAWRQIADAGNVGEYQDRMGRMDRAINALAASRSDKT